MRKLMKNQDFRCDLPSVLLEINKIKRNNEFLTENDEVYSIKHEFSHEESIFRGS